jgi:hypothetical protein
MYKRIMHSFLFLALIFTSACNKNTNRAREYLYEPGSAIPANHAVIVSKVFDNRPEKERAQMVHSMEWINAIGSKLNYMTNIINNGIRQNVFGVKQIRIAAQVILSNQYGNKYYLGDYYQVGIFDGENRRLKVGNKGQLEVYPGMAAYSIVCLPAGEYKIIGYAYYENIDKAGVSASDIRIREGFLHSSQITKSFIINPQDVVYIGDIGVSKGDLIIENKSQEVQEFIDIAYPSIAQKLRFKPIT